MRKKKNSLVFFGSGPVAAQSLSLLIDHLDIETIVTKPSTFGQMSSIATGVPVLTANNRAELDELIRKSKFSSEAGLLIDFGIIISKTTINYFKKGIINSHFSLLPELRGADPISFAILEDKTETGVSLMLLSEGMDEGPIIVQDSLRINDTETTTTLTDKLVSLSDTLIKDHLQSYMRGDITPVKQEDLDNKKSISYTRKLTKDDSVIDWNKPAETIEKEVRAYDGWPRSQTSLNGIDLTITKAKVAANSGKPGELYLEDGILGVYCGEASLIIESVLPSGKKEMDSKAFLAGYKSRLGL